MRKLCTMMSVAAATLGLAACGGGGGGGGSPAPVASPTPPVAAAPTTNTTLTNLVASQSFATAANGLAGTYVNATGVTTPTSYSPGGADGLGIAYNAADQSYTVSVYGETNTFTPANRDAAHSTNLATAYSRTSGATDYNLVLANPAAVQLTYSSYGVWQRDVTGSPNSTLHQSVFVYGIPTASSDLPRTGSATYSTAVGGFWVAGGDVRVLSGTSTFSADFGAGTTRLDMTMVGKSQLAGGGTFAFGSVGGAGSINSSNATISGALGSTSAASAGYSGVYAGRFYGPQAAEVGVVFDLQRGSNVVQGYVVGKK
jgi:hypothetical protein